MVRRIREDTKQVTAGFALFTVIVVPVFTLLFLTFDNPFLRTMSYMGNNGHRLVFLLWGILSATLLSLFAIRIYNGFAYQSIHSRRLMAFSYLFLILTVIIPSLAELPTLGNLHNLMAIAFVASISLSLLFFLLYVRSLDRAIGNVSLSLYFMTLGVPLAFLFFFGHSGMYEIVFFVVISGFLFLLDRVILPRSPQYRKNPPKK